MLKKLWTLLTDECLMAGSSVFRWLDTDVPLLHTGAATTVVAAIRVHGLVHVVDPGLVPAPEGGHALTAAADLALAAVLTLRALVDAPAAVPAHDHALGIEMLS